MRLKQWLPRLNRIFEKIKGLKASSFFVCFLAGVLYALPYYFKQLFFLSYVSLTILFIILLSNGRRRKFFRFFYAFSFGFYFTLYLWLSNLYPFNGFGFSEGQAKIIIVLACIGIPLYHALLHSVVMSLTKLLSNKPSELIIGFGLAWILSEWIMSLGLLGFPWGRMALSQVGVLFSVQTVSLFGSYFIVAIVVCSCMLFALAITNKKRSYAFFGLMIILSNMIVGTILYFLPVETASEGVKVAILQGNASMEDKWSGEKSTFVIWETYLEMIKEAAQNGAKVVVLPESAIPKDFSAIKKSLLATAVDYNITIVAGVLIESEEEIGTYNSVLALYPDDSISVRYDKRHIVPFGEYIPYRDFLESILPFIGELNLGDFTTIQGEDTAIFEVEGIDNGSLVCFDSIFDTIARESVNDGAEILTVVTNDSWFKDSVGIKQHLNHSVLRAIENRRYIIRAANTGISAYISPKGDVITQTEALTEDILYCEVAAIESKTLYTLVGNAMLNFAQVFYIFIVIFRIYIKIKGRKKDGNKKTV